MNEVLPGQLEHTSLILVIQAKMFLINPPQTKNSISYQLYPILNVLFNIMPREQHLGLRESYCALVCECTDNDDQKKVQNRKKKKSPHLDLRDAFTSHLLSMTTGDEVNCLVFLALHGISRT